MIRKMLDISVIMYFLYAVLVLQVMKREMAMKRHLKQRIHETSRVRQNECGEVSVANPLRGHEILLPITSHVYESTPSLILGTIKLSLNSKLPLSSMCIVSNRTLTMLVGGCG
jgi:hypothetical protein